jgi:dihydroorotase
MESTSNASPPSLWLPLIDDFHLHLRDGEAMAALMAGESEVSVPTAETFRTLL